MANRLSGSPIRDIVTRIRPLWTELERFFAKIGKKWPESGICEEIPSAKGV
jgi:hypothetical protein